MFFLKPLITSVVVQCKGPLSGNYLPCVDLGLRRWCSHSNSLIFGPHPIPNTWLSRCEADFLPTAWLGGCELISCCPARRTAVSFVDIVVPRGDGGGGLEIEGEGTSNDICSGGKADRDSTK
jgi:hypothetical protein